jgi:hypothetical protein
VEATKAPNLDLVAINQSRSHALEDGLDKRLGLGSGEAERR